MRASDLAGRGARISDGCARYPSGRRSGAHPFPDAAGGFGPGRRAGRPHPPRHQRSERPVGCSVRRRRPALEGCRAQRRPDRRALAGLKESPMPLLTDLRRDDLAAFHRDVEQRYGAFRARGLTLDMTRGKPSPEQLDLSNALLELPGRDGWRTADGGDGRNYFGDPAGLPETRTLFAPMLGVPPDQVLIGDNSSLALMHDAIAYA